MHIFWSSTSEMWMMEYESIFSPVDFMEAIHVQLLLGKNNLSYERFYFGVAEVSVQDLIFELF